MPWIKKVTKRDNEALRFENQGYIVDFEEDDEPAKTKDNAMSENLFEEEHGVPPITYEPKFRSIN